MLTFGATLVRTFAQLAARGSLLINDGYRTKRSELGEPGFPVLRVAEVGDGWVTPTYGDHVRDEFQDKIGPKLSRAGDVLLTTKGTIGRRAIMPVLEAKFAYSPQLCFFRVLDNTLDHRWLYYWLASPDFWDQATGVSQQTDMAPYISLRDLRAINVGIPPIATQRSIAATLGALDAKIESNRRATEMLGELARLTFLRWRTSTLLQCETRFGEYADVYGGATPKTSVPEYWNGALAWTTPTDVTGLLAPYLFRTGRTITAQGLASCSAAMHPPGTIFMTSRATIGAFVVNQISAATNQGFIAVRPRQEFHRWFLFEEMRRRVPEFIDNANGSTFLEISRGRFKELPLSVPPSDEIREIDSQLAPLHAKSAQLAQESRKIAALRDVLLPELLSGRIGVPEAVEVVHDVVSESEGA